MYVYILARLVWMHGWRGTLCVEHYPMWIALGVALAYWLLCEFGCALSTTVFYGHAVWHVGIGYVAIYLTIIGAQHTYKLERTPSSSVWWPKLQERSRRDGLEMLIPKEFCVGGRRVS